MKLTTHVLDTANGVPAENIKIELYEITGKNQKNLLKTTVTNDDGRTDEPMLAGDTFKHGVYELVFYIGDYFGGSTNGEPLFLDAVPLQFGINSDAHYHVPLLASPWSYSTYRGS